MDDDNAKIICPNCGAADNWQIMIDIRALLRMDQTASGPAPTLELYQDSLLFINWRCNACEYELGETSAINGGLYTEFTDKMQRATELTPFWG